jgi:hypothetical protein
MEQELFTFLVRAGVIALVMGVFLLVAYIHAAINGVDDDV